MQSAVLIIPAEHRGAANAFGETMGWGAENYTVPLSPTGAPPATHWGCRANVSDSFVALLGAPPLEAAAILSVLAVDLRVTSAPHDHFNDVTASMGLIQVDQDG